MLRWIARIAERDAALWGVTGWSTKARAASAAQAVGLSDAGEAWHVAQRIAHHQLHRWEYSQGIICPEQGDEAAWYAAALLLPRETIALSPQWQELLRLRAAGCVDDRHLAEAAESLARSVSLPPIAVRIRFTQLLEREPIALRRPARHVDERERMLG